jgi:hypothetical protein
LRHQSQPRPYRSICLPCASPLYGAVNYNEIHTLYFGLWVLGTLSFRNLPRPTHALHLEFDSSLPSAASFLSIAMARTVVAAPGLSGYESPHVT